MSQENQEPEELMDIIAKYAKEYGEDTYLDELKLRESLLKMAGIKGKWISYKCINKAQLIKLKKQKDKLMDEGVDLIKNKREEDGNPVSKKGAEMIIKDTKRYKELDYKIQTLTALVEYFNDSVDAIKGINWDVKNLLDDIKMDEM